jgi:hypothetical protein
MCYTRRDGAATEYEALRLAEKQANKKAQTQPSRESVEKKPLTKKVKEMIGASRWPKREESTSDPRAVLPGVFCCLWELRGFRFLACAEPPRCRMGPCNLVGQRPNRDRTGAA